MTTTAAPPRTLREEREAFRPQGKRDMEVCWWILIGFYNLFGVIFVLLARVMPPQRPDRNPAQIARFFHAHSATIQLGFSLLMVVMAFSVFSNALVVVQMKRMSVKPVFAYSYIATLGIAAIPGCLFCGFCFLAAAFRPDRDPHLLALLYDMAFLSFVGSMGCFAAQYLILALAILLDKNEIFPTWFAYVTIWQIMTEVLAAPVFVFTSGPFAWNGSIAFWQGTVLFVVYEVAIIYLLRLAIKAQPMDERIPD